MMRDISRVLALVVLTAGLAMACAGSGENPAQPPTEAEASSTRPAGILPVPGEKPGAADSALPPGHPPVSGQSPGQGVMGIEAPDPKQGTGRMALEWNVPGEWTEIPPISSLRRAQYRVPGPGGDGECIVFYFGPGQGGEPIANAERWASQFKLADGSPATATMKTSTMKVGEIDVLSVEVKGTYAGGMTGPMAPPAEEKPGYMLLGAVAKGPDSNWFFKLTGPEATVEAQRAAFEGMMRSLRRG